MKRFFCYLTMILGFGAVFVGIKFTVTDFITGLAVFCLGGIVVCIGFLLAD